MPLTLPRHEIEDILQKGMGKAKLIQLLGQPDNSYLEHPGENWDESLFFHLRSDPDYKQLWVQILSGTVIGWAWLDFM